MTKKMTWMSQLQLNCVWAEWGLTEDNFSTLITESKT